MKPLCAHCTWWTSPNKAERPTFDHCERCGAPVMPPPPARKDEPRLFELVVLLVLCAAGGAAVGMVLQSLGVGL